MTYEKAYSKYNLMLHKLSHKYTLNGYDTDDMYQEFCSVLLKCVDGYNKKCGMFSTYLTNSCKNRWVVLNGKQTSKNKQVPMSLDYVLPSDKEVDTLLDVIEDNTYRADKPEFVELVKTVKQMLEHTYRGELLLLNYYYGLTNRDIGVLFGISGERVRQINAKTIERLREVINND